jgi:hypothetical protein
MQVAKDRIIFFFNLNLFTFDQDVLLTQFYILYHTGIILLMNTFVVYIDMLW